MQRPNVDRGQPVNQAAAGSPSRQIAIEAFDAVSGCDENGPIAKHRGERIRQLLRARLGDEIFTSWFNALELEEIRDSVIVATVPVKFLRNWIQTHYVDDLVACCRSEFPSAESVDVRLRQHNTFVQAEANRPNEEQVQPLQPAPAPATAIARPPQVSSAGNGLSGSPLDPRLTFDTFVVGPANRMAHAAATQVAETLFGESRGFNPLCIHAAVGLGKTHLLHAIAWEIRRRHPQANSLYLTAERFRYEFVEALQAKDALAFKERLRSVDILLVDDLEFLHGQATAQEFDHIVNALLDGGRQIVVASSKAPNAIESLGDRMRSRLQRGLVVELASPDLELRMGILKRRIEEKRLNDPSFQVPADVIEVLAEQLTESGRELEGAATKLHAQWQCMRQPITMELAQSMVRDLVYGLEPRRIRVEDIVKVVSRHYGVSRNDILSQRRHRSVVWPRQIGMYLAKQLTARSLPEIGRRFGNRDHTTVLHAIRKINTAIEENPRLRDELEDLKKMLAH